jgi:hypothetical protein
MVNQYTKYLVEDMTPYGIPYFGDNDKIAGAIAFVLQKVPEPVRNFAFQRCIFSSLPKNIAGSFRNLVIRPGTILSSLFLIEISEELPFISSYRYRKYSQNTLQFFVALDIAHAYLNHDGYYPEKERCEAEANQLAEQWGFRLKKGSEVDVS